MSINKSSTGFWQASDTKKVSLFSSTFELKLIEIGRGPTLPLMNESQLGPDDVGPRV